MLEVFGITPQALVAQLLVGLINGSFYAILSLGLAIIFGLLNVINFTHGAQYMLGAFFAWIGLTQVGNWLGMPDFSINYWVALVAAPLLVGAIGIVMERLMLKRLYHLDHLYGLLLTFGLALVIEGMFRHWYGISGESYSVPEALQGGFRLESFGLFLPKYRVWVIVASLAWLLGQVADFSTRLTKIEGSMPALITKEGVPTDSPVSAEKRAILKEQLMQHINELQVKVRLLEEREKLGKR